MPSIKLIKENIKKAARSNLLIGFTGHRNLNEATEKVVREKICDYLSRNRKQTVIVLVGAKALGEKGGTDEIVAEVCQDLSIKMLPVEGLHFEELAQLMAIYCHEIFAVWDGQFRGSKGGTSDVIRMVTTGKAWNQAAISKKVKSQELIQLVVDRAEGRDTNGGVIPGNNFPLGRRWGKQKMAQPPAKQYELIYSTIPAMTTSMRKKFDRQFFINGLGLSIGIFLLFFIIDKFICKDGGEFFLWPSIAAGIYSLVVYIAYKLFVDARRIFIEFVIPIAIALFVIGTGWYGFYEAEFEFDYRDSFSAALNLLTLNASIFDQLGETYKMSLWLENARILGAFFLVYAFIYALVKATGRENMNRIYFWLYRWLPWNKFTVVLGDGPLAINLAVNLNRENKKVFYLSDYLKEEQVHILSENSIWYFSGNTTAKSDLEKTYFQSAENIFIIKESDEENIRSLQELCEKPAKLGKVKEIFVSIHRENSRSLISTLLHNQPVRIFNIHEQIARKLIFQHPIDRFTENITTAHVKIFGFGAVAEKILLHVLRIGHYLNNKSLQIQVYYSSNEATRAKQFQARFPELINEPDNRSGIWKYTFSSLAPLTFNNFDPQVTHPETVFNDLSPSACTSVFICLGNGIEGAAYLGESLPFLKHAYKKRKCDIKVLLAYDYPDREEEEFIEYNLNKTAYPIGVHTFGNLLNESEMHTIKLSSNLALAKLLNWRYDKIYKEGSNMAIDLENLDFAEATMEAELLWTKLSELHKLSNMIAADHAWVKLREYESTTHLTAAEKDKIIAELAEVEHRRWCAEKLFYGYRHHLDRDESRKLHPDLIPFDKLKPDDQSKDSTQVAFVQKFETYLRTLQ